MKSFLSLLSVTILSCPFSVSAGPYTKSIISACPQSSQIEESREYWEVGTDDKSAAEEHLGWAKPIKTIDKSPSSITAKDYVNDPLTVASECLLYRSLAVDTAAHVDSQDDVPPNLTTGWMPAIF